MKKKNSPVPVYKKRGMSLSYADAYLAMLAKDGFFFCSCPVCQGKKKFAFADRYSPGWLKSIDISIECWARMESEGR
jgi:hypothetical protein